MTYIEALNKANKEGTSKTEDLPLLAITIATLAQVHAISPQLVFDEAVRQGLSAYQVRKLNPITLANLMFQ